MKHLRNHSLTHSLSLTLHIPLTMPLTAVITDWAQPPKVTTRDLPPAPTDADTVRIRVRAAGLHALVRLRATGHHYTSGALPHIPGIDGTGVDVATGQPVYFNVLGVPGSGSFQEFVDVPRRSVKVLPEGVDLVYAAAMLNPVMSSWMALKSRVDWLRDGRERKGWTLVILGATSVSGQIAVRVARAMGATKVIGAARNEAALQALGLDGYVVLKDTPSATQWEGTGAAEADVVLDYLYGPWPAAYFDGTAEEAKTKGAPGGVTYVNIGGLAGTEAELSSAVLRSRDVTVRGAGPGAWSLPLLGAETGNMVAFLKGASAGEGEVKEVKLGNVEEGWAYKGKGRVVFVTDGWEDEA